MKKAIIVGLITITLLISALSLIPTEKTVPTHVLSSGDTNAFIGQGGNRHGSLASDPTNWNLGHVPVTGEDIQYDARSGKANWDIDVDVANFITLENATQPIFLINNHLHIMGDLIILGDCTIISSGNLNDNFVVDGETCIRGNSSSAGISLGANSGSFSYYFNGFFDVQLPTIGTVGFSNCGNVEFNDTVVMNGTWHDSDNGVNYGVQVKWDTGTYMHFKKDVVFQGIHALSIAGGRADANITFKDIGAGADPTGLLNPVGWLLMMNDPNSAPFTFYKMPVFDNITKCASCEYSAYAEIRYNGEVNFGIWDGWYTDFIHKLDVNVTGMVNQSYSAQYGSVSLAPGVLNIYAGIYRVNGPYHLVMSYGSGTGGSGKDYNSILNVYSTFELDSGFLASGYVNLFNGGTFKAENGTMEIDNLDTSNGTFIAGNSTLILNSTGIIKTDGTQRCGVNNLVIMPHVTITLRSDVYVNGKYTNLGGTVVEGVYHLHYNGSSNDAIATFLPDHAKRDTNAFIGAGIRIGASASDPANWYLGHVPVDGEDLLFDARAGNCKWDITVVKLHDVLLKENFTHNLNIVQGSMHITGNLTINATDAGLLIFELSGGNFVVDGWTHVGDSSILGGTETASIFASYFNGSVDMEFPHGGQFTWGGASYVVFNSTVALNGTTMPMDYVTNIVQAIWHTGAYLVFKGDVIFNGVHQLLIGSGQFEANLTVANILDCLLIPDYPDSGTTFMYQPILVNIPESA
jgi:hypothetical protein